MTVLMPPALAALPRDKRGRVVGWATGWRDGEPLMGVNDGRRCAQAILERRCGQCGEKLGYWIAFLGDEECVGLRRFTEPPMHDACARYALAVCPYLSHPSYESRRDLTGVLVIASRARPARMGLYVTRDYRPDYDSDAPMAHAAAPKTVEWF